MKFSLCTSQWEFIPEWFDGFALGEGSGEEIRIPHNVKEMPLHYSDHMAYQMVCGYRRKLELGEELSGKKIFLQFDGAAHIATVYVNGAEVAHHRTGYTAGECGYIHTGLVEDGQHLVGVFEGAGGCSGSLGTCVQHLGDVLAFVLGAGDLAGKVMGKLGAPVTVDALQFLVDRTQQSIIFCAESLQFGGLGLQFTGG